jgi:hypothetical protein
MTVSLSSCFPAIGVDSISFPENCRIPQDAPALVSRFRKRLSGKWFYRYNGTRCVILGELLATGAVVRKLESVAGDG